VPVLVLLAHAHVWTKPACCSQRLLQGSADNWLIRRLECKGIVHIFALRRGIRVDPYERGDWPNFSLTPGAPFGGPSSPKDHAQCALGGGPSVGTSSMTQDKATAICALTSQGGSAPSVIEQASSSERRRASAVEREVALAPLTDGSLAGHRWNVHLSNAMLGSASR
jgi:hypothetical protein